MLKLPTTNPPELSAHFSRLQGTSQATAETKKASRGKVGEDSGENDPPGNGYIHIPPFKGSFWVDEFSKLPVLVGIC